MLHGPNMCASCIHILTTNYGEKPTCEAFLGGIPDDIFYAGEPHEEPRDGDGGIVYEMDPEFEDMLDMYREYRKFMLTLEDPEVLNES